MRFSVDARRSGPKKVRLVAIALAIGAGALSSGCKTSHVGAEGSGGAGPGDDAASGAGGGSGSAGAPGSGGMTGGTGGITSAGAGGNGAGSGGAGGGADPCKTALYCDDFERYTAGAAPTTPWRASTNMGAVAVDTTHARSGTKAVKMTTQARTSDGGK